MHICKLNVHIFAALKSLMCLTRVCVCVCVFYAGACILITFVTQDKPMGGRVINVRKKIDARITIFTETSMAQ